MVDARGRVLCATPRLSPADAAIIAAAPEMLDLLRELAPAASAMASLSRDPRMDRTVREAAESLERRLGALLDKLGRT